MRCSQPVVCMLKCYIEAHIDDLSDVLVMYLRLKSRALLLDAQLHVCDGCSVLRTSGCSHRSCTSLHTVTAKCAYTLCNCVHTLHAVVIRSSTTSKRMLVCTVVRALLLTLLYCVATLLCCALC
jgi:hypothetical protein